MLLELDFLFFVKKCIFYQIYEQLHVEHSMCYRMAQTEEIEKLILQSFRSVKNVAFLYRSHGDLMRIYGDQVGEKSFSEFFICVRTSLLDTLNGCREKPVKAQKTSKTSIFHVHLNDTQQVVGTHIFFSTWKLAKE